MVPLASCETRALALRRLRHMTLGELELVLAHDAQRWPDEFAALERLLALCPFSAGDLDERLCALPLRAFASAALDLYELGWIDTTKEDD